MRRLLTACALAVVAACARPTDVLHLATTTSVENSGLLASILPQFQSESGITVQALAVGSGRALDILDRRDADAALTHDPEAEQKYVERGVIAEYRKIMFNDFVISGPAADSAGIKSAATAAEAMSRIAASTASFASRADSSGTHARELLLWRAAGRTPESPRLIETGQGMSATLRIASERQAYVLTDRATLLQLQPTLRLVILSEGDPALLNTYAVMIRQGLEGSRRENALALVRWLTDGKGRDAIGAFQIGGKPAFMPWPPGAPRSSPHDLPHAR